MINTIGTRSRAAKSLCDACRVVFYEAVADFHAVLLETKEEAHRKIMNMCGKTDAEERGNEDERI